MTPATAIGMGASVIALAVLTAIGIRAGLRAASRRVQILIAQALDYDPLDDIPADWTDDIDDEYRQLIEENA